MKKIKTIFIGLLLFGSLSQAAWITNLTKEPLVLNNWRTINPNKRVSFTPFTHFTIKKKGWKTDTNIYPFSDEASFNIYSDGKYGLKVETWKRKGLKYEPKRNLTDAKSTMFIRWVEESPSKALQEYEKSIRKATGNEAWKWSK